MTLTNSNSLLEIIRIIAAALRKSRIRAKISYRLKHPSPILKEKWQGRVTVTLSS